MAATTGGCLCGAIRYRVDGPLRPIVACHCGQCLKWHGHFAPYTACAPGDLELEGADHLKWFASSAIAERGFCSACGSSLFWRPRSGTHVSITAGSLDQPCGLRLEAHIFCDSTADYYDVPDGAPGGGDIV